MRLAFSGSPFSYSLQSGACGGETACSTCHVIMSPEVFAKLPEPSEAEEDMLDLAAGLTKTSRLGCQVRASEADERAAEHRAGRLF